MDKSKQAEQNARKQMGFVAFGNRRYPVYEGLNIIGRDPKSTIRVKDLTFSKFHAIISILNETTHWISDFGSSNGTELDGKKLIPLKFYELKDLEAITFGDIVGMYHTDTSQTYLKNDTTATQSQIIDNLAETQILTQNLHDLPTQDIVNNKKYDFKLHSEPTQLLDKIKDGETTGDQTNLKSDKNNRLSNEDTERFNVSHSELNDDIFANETFRASFQNSKCDMVVDETLPTETKPNETYIDDDDDDVILSTQDDAKIEKESRKFCRIQRKSAKSLALNKDESDSATDIEDEDALAKQIQEKSTLSNNKEIEIESGSDTDVDEDLLKKKSSEPVKDASDNKEDKFIADISHQKSDLNLKEKPVSDEEDEIDFLENFNDSVKASNEDLKMDDGNDEALLLVPTQLLANEKCENKSNEQPKLKSEDKMLQDDDDCTQIGDEIRIDDDEVSPTDKNKSEICALQQKNDDDDLPATQLLTTKTSSDSVFLVPTQVLEQNRISTRKSTRVLTTKQKEIDEDDDLPATQLLQPETTDDSVSTAPIQIKLSTKQRQNENDEGDNDDDLPPTQLLQPETSKDSVSTAPNQVRVSPRSKHSISSSEKGQIANDSVFLASTQILETKNVSPNKKSSILCLKSPQRQKKSVNFSENIFDLPTQKLEDNIRETPPQLLKESKKPNIISKESIFEAPTQILEKDNIFDATTQLLEKENSHPSSENCSSTDSNNMKEYFSESLKLVLSESEDDFKEETTYSSKSSKEEVANEIETQMEVEFELETQKLYVEEKTSRPDNPLGHIFDEEPTQMTEDLMNKKTEPIITSKSKLDDIESSRKLQIKLQNIVTKEASSSKNTVEDNDFETEIKKRRPSKSKKVDRFAQNAPKLNVTKVQYESKKDETKQTDIKTRHKGETIDKERKLICKEETNENATKLKQKEKTVEKECETKLETTGKGTKFNFKKASNQKVTKLEEKEQTVVKESKKSNKETKLRQKDTITREKDAKMRQTEDTTVKEDAPKLKINKKVPKTEIDEKSDTDKPHNTRGKKISYQQLNAGKVENKKSTKITPQKSEIDDRKEALDVKKSATTGRRQTRDKQPVKEESIKAEPNEDSSDFDDFINRVTRSKRAHSVAETPKKKMKKEVEPASKSTSTSLKKKDVKLECSPDSEYSEVIPKTKRSMKIEDYSSDEDTNAKSRSVCLNTPNSKKRRYEPLNNSGDSVKHKIVFTMINDTTIFENSIKKLGGNVIDDIEQCSVLITNKISRSLKFLLAVALAKPIVGPKWIEDSYKENIFLDPWNYLLVDKESEAKFELSLKKSLKKSAEKKLLADLTILVAAQKNQEILKELVQASGAKLIQRAPGKNIEAVVVSYEEEKTKYSKYLKQKNLNVVSAEAIFSGILKQEIDWKKYLLK